MIVSTVCVSGVDAVAVNTKKITAGMIGAKIAMEYDETWEGLLKKVIFDGAVTVPAIGNDNIITIPVEALTDPGALLRVGVYGISEDGRMAIPTIWAELGTVLPGAPGEAVEPGGQAPGDWAQIYAMIGDLRNLDTEAKENLVKAINEVHSKIGTGGGNVDLSDYAKIDQLPDSTSDLKNDSGFITRLVADLANYYAKNETYTREEIDQRISAIPRFSVAVVSALPSQNISETTIYLLTTGNATGDLYSEWIFANGKWELLGSQRVDLNGYATEKWVQEGYQPKGEYLTKAPVQSVNGKTGAVQLGASDVGALPNTYTPPNQTAEQVGADSKGTAASAVSQHNTADDSHGDIRLELKAINDRLTAFFDSDNQTLDELSEIVAYITSNKSLIDSITTSKVSVTDIIDNLTTNVANKPLSAAQGVVLKSMIDAVSTSLSNYQPKGDYALASQIPTVPTKVSAFTNDAGYLTQHQDISGKLDKDKLPEAVDTALAQAKASGEFDGEDGNTSVKVMTKVEYSKLTQDAVKQLYDAGIRMIIVEDGYINLVSQSTDAAGNIYQGCGYLNGYRLTSSGGLAVSDNCCVSGFMPYVHGHTIRIVGSCGNTLSNGGHYVGVYDASHNVIHIAYPSNLVNSGAATWEPRADGLWELTIDTSKVATWSNAKYFRASCVLCVGADMVVTVNEPIGLEA